MSTISKIKTLPDLLHWLNTGPGYDGYEALMEAIAFDESELKDYLFWKEGEEPAKIRIDGGETFELAILCWESGQKSKFHDHDDQQSWIKVIKGSLTEELMKLKDGKPHKIAEDTYEKGQVVYVNDDIGFHRLKNDSPDQAISIHLYIDPIKAYNTYSETEGVQKEETKYDK